MSRPMKQSSVLTSAALAALLCCAAGQTPAQPAQPAASPPATPAPAQPPSAPNQSALYTLDLNNSMIQFYVNAKLTNVKGIFRSFRLAEISQPAAGLAALRGRILIDTASVFTREKKRDDHLRADDFFWSEKFPEASVLVKNIVPVSGTTYNVTISLRIRDKEKDFTVPVQIVETSTGLTAAGEFIVDRTYYDLTGEYLANKVMDDEAQISFKFTLIKAR